MRYKKLTAQIVRCAYRVYNNLGYGFLESVYENCLAIEFQKDNLRAQFQYPITIQYKGQIVGNFKAGILVEDLVLVEMKPLITLNKAHEAQLVNYLTATGKEVGLLINFGESELEIKRKSRLLPSQ